MSDNYYDYGWNAYVDGKPCPSKLDRNAYNGWKDARLCQKLDGKLPAKI